MAFGIWLSLYFFKILGFIWVTAKLLAQPLLKTSISLSYLLLLGQWAAEPPTGPECGTKHSLHTCYSYILGCTHMDTIWTWVEWCHSRHVDQSERMWTHAKVWIDLIGTSIPICVFPPPSLFSDISVSFSLFSKDVCIQSGSKVITSGVSVLLWMGPREFSSLTVTI